MTLLYKLTTPEHTTINNTLWGENVEHTASGIGELCSAGFLHAYTHPLLAVLLNPIHADISSPVLWECDGNVIKSDRGLKVGCDRLKTIRIIPLPEITIAQKIAFGILCAKEVTTDTKWHEWANKWLSGEDRTTKAAYAYASAAYASAYASAGAYAYASAAAYASAGASAAYASATASYAYTAYTFAAADAYAAPMDLIAIAEKAMTF